jgi:hypothetical protein
MALTIAEYARKHGIAEVGIYKRIRAGKIAAEKIGGKWVIDEAPAGPAGGPLDTETLKRQKLEAEIAHLNQKLAEKVAEAEAAGAMKLARMLGPVLGSLRKWVGEVCAKLDAAEVRP